MRRSLANEKGARVSDSTAPVGDYCDDETELTDGFRVFVDRRIAFNIDFVFASLDREAMSLIEFDGARKKFHFDGGFITIETPELKIKIEGLNLLKMYQLMLDHEVGEIIEQHEPQHVKRAVASQDKAYIEKITWNVTS